MKKNEHIHHSLTFWVVLRVFGAVIPLVCACMTWARESKLTALQTKVICLCTRQVQDRKQQCMLPYTVLPLCLKPDLEYPPLGVRRPFHLYSTFRSWSFY